MKLRYIYVWFHINVGVHHCHTCQSYSFSIDALGTACTAYNINKCSICRERKMIASVSRCGATTIEWKIWNTHRQIGYAKTNWSKSNFFFRPFLFHANPHWEMETHQTHMGCGVKLKANASQNQREFGWDFSFVRLKDFSASTYDCYYYCYCYVERLLPFASVHECECEL